MQSDDQPRGRVEEERWGRFLKNADALALVLVAVSSFVTACLAAYVALTR